MTKRELIEAVANARPHLARRDLETLVNAVFKTLTDALTRGERIEIRGFGSFIVKRRNAREGLNPKTGEAVSVAAKRVPFFKAGKELKMRVDHQKADARVEATAAGASGSYPTTESGVGETAVAASAALREEH